MMDLINQLAFIKDLPPLVQDMILNLILLIVAVLMVLLLRLFIRRRRFGRGGAGILDINRLTGESKAKVKLLNPIHDLQVQLFFEGGKCPPISQQNLTSHQHIKRTRAEIHKMHDDRIWIDIIRILE